MMSLNSASQTLSQATFATVESDIITNHHLQIIVPSNAIEEVFLDGVQIPSLNFNVFDGNQEYSFADVEIPEGSHTLFCEQRFIANVYGIGDAESYFYSTGASASDPLEPIPTVFCTDNQVILETAENYTNIWWSTIEEPEVSIFVGQPFVIDPPIQNQIYILNGDNFLSGCPEQEFYSVESPSPLSVDILEDEIDLCLFEQFSLSSDVTPQGSGYVYQWSDESAFITNENQTGLISPSQSGTYYLDVFTFSGCAVGIDSVLVNVINDDITSVYASIEPESICEGQSVALSMNTGYNSGLDQFNSGTLNNSLWSNDQGSEISNLCGSEGTSSIYFNGIGSRFIESIDLDMNEGGTIQFSLFISDGSNTCDGAEFGEDVQLEYSINGGINWIPISIFFEDQFPNFENIEILIPPGAETNSTRFRWIQNNFTGLNEDIWALDNIIFSSFGPDFEPVSWTSSDIIDDPSLPETSSFPSESGYFYLESQIGVCTYTDSVFIEVDPSFDLTISEDTTICSPLPVSLLVSTSEPGFYTYQWDNDNFLNASNTANPIAIPEESTIFSVQVNSPFGCSQSAEVEINLLSEEAPFIFTESSSVCEGPIPLEVVVQDDPNDYTFEWSPAELLDDQFAQSVNAFPESGSFNTLEVNVTNTVTGCTNTASQTLSALFAEFELPSDTIICESEGFVLEYNVINSMFNAIEWDNPDVLDNAFTQFPTITVPDFNGDLVVTMFVPGIGGCSVSDTISIITQELEIEVPDVLSNCLGQEIQTEITGDFNSISWLPSENLDDSQDDFPIFSNEETETFYYSAEGGGGCTLNDSIQIVINLPESFEILASELLCEGAEINLSHPISGMNYLWNTNETTEAITISNSGSYNLEVMDSAGCIVSDEIEIEMFNAPNFEITGETEVCEGESIILTADIVDVDYLWSNLETNQTEEFSLSGAVDIWAEVTDIMGCTFRDSVLINFRPDPDLLLESSGSICEGSSVIISAQSDMVDFLWETNQTTDQIEVFESQFYSVTVTDAFNCSRSDSIFISEVIFPENFELDNSFCQGTELIISPEVNSNFDVSWSTGEESNVLSINQAGEYQMILENDNCIQEYDFTIFEDECPEPYIYVPNAFTPDGDGVNDHWSAIVSELIIDFEVQVFNRDGDLIFQSKDPLDIWTGNVYNGEYYAPNGVYSYKITYHTESEIEGLISDHLYGHISLIR